MELLLPSQNVFKISLISKINLRNSEKRPVDFSSEIVLERVLLADLLNFISKIASTSHFVR